MDLIPDLALQMAKFRPMTGLELHDHPLDRL
jgi:hypothetical protein